MGDYYNSRFNNKRALKTVIDEMDIFRDENEIPDYLISIGRKKNMRKQ